MKKISILLGAIVLTGLSYGAQFELKGGFEPWREANNSYVGLEEGWSLGAEVLYNSITRPFDYGFGAEWKSELKADNASGDGTDAFPIYLTGKYGIGDDLFYLVGRAGWTLYDDSDMEEGFYGAAGIGKSFGKFSVEALYESIDVNNTSKMYSKGRVSLASLKFGYRFGENKRDVITQEAKEKARLEYEKAVKEAEELKLLELAEARETKLEKYKGLIVASGYTANVTTADIVDPSLIEEMKADLAGEEGVLVVSGYTDNSGATNHNEEISLQRAENVGKLLEEKLENENIDVIYEGLGETNFLNENKTLEEREANRRVEVEFISK